MAEPYNVEPDAKLKTGEVIPVGTPVPGYTAPPSGPAAAPASAARPPTGAAILEDSKDEVAPEFCTAHSPGLNVLGAIGGVLLLFALIAAGVSAGGQGYGFWGSFGKIILAFWEAVVHTGSGVAAVAIAAWMLGQRFGSLEFAIGRMFVAFVVFLFVMQLDVPPKYIGDIVRIILAGLVYWTAVMIMFRKSPREASMIGIAHAALWLFVKLGLLLAGTVTAAPAVVAAPAGGV